MPLPWENDPIVGGSPQAAQQPGRPPAFIPGTPKPADPVQDRKDQIDITKGELDIQARELSLAEQQAKIAEKEIGAKLGKEAGFYLRSRAAGEAFDTLGVGAESQIRAAGKGVLPQDWMNAWTPEQRQKAETYMEDFIAASLRYESGAAIGQDEFNRQARIYFPQPGDSEGTVKAKAQLRKNMIEALGMGAGPEAVSEVDAYLNAANPVDEAGTNPFAHIIGEDGKPLGPEGGYGMDPETGEWSLHGRVTDDSPNQAVAAEAERLDQLTGPLGGLDLAKHGLTLGLTDEASGIGTAISGALQGDFNISQNYRLGRDAQEMRLDQARDRLGGIGTAAEFAGGFALPANALTKFGSVAAAARGGAVAGGVGGYGYGRDETSGNNALIGALGGAALGAAGQKLGNALAGRQSANLGDRARSLDAAGRAENVTVNRAMVDPNSNNAVTKADATLLGGRAVQREMGAIEGQIEGRVADLGRGGQAMDDIATGDKVKQAAERFIDKSGKAAKVKYDRAEKLAGNAKVEPKESLRRVDEMIAELGETGNTNSAEIAFLQGIRDDLGKELSVGALRRMRTQLRKRISKGDLVFGESEARVLSIMDGAADDIRAGLTTQGNAKAARAFDAADKAYRARMDYISGTVQKLIGKRNANLSAEQVARKFTSMTKTDARGLRQFYATLDPSEQADVAATFAEQLGKNNKGDFSVAHFLSQSEKMSDEAIRTVFGQQGAESIKNLRTLGAEVNRVTGAMNSRTSKSGVASYRDWLWSLASGGGGMLAGNAGTAVGAAAGVAGATAAKQMISAKLLMSPKITKWLSQAPRTTSPKVIDQHFERLGEIAKAEPALAQDIDALRQGIMGAANDNVGVSAAAGDAEEK